MILEQTGIYSAYETEWRQGFNIGLKYATNGTDKVNGQKLDINWDDDADNPTTAVSDFKAYVGAGYKIIGVPVTRASPMNSHPWLRRTSSVHLGAAADDAITGVNRYTFRSGRQTYQDVQTAKSYVQALGTGKTILVLGQDFAFGQSYVTDATNAFKSLGDTVDSLLVPLTTTDFTSTALQVQQDHPDIIFLAWAGTTGAPLMQALSQEGALTTAHVVTGLANIATYPFYARSARRSTTCRSTCQPVRRTSPTNTSSRRWNRSTSSRPTCSRRTDSYGPRCWCAPFNPVTGRTSTR